MLKLSVVLATYNEEENIGACLASVKDLSDGIIVVDGSSTDQTREIAESFGAKVIKTQNHPNFHINKQKAIGKAKGKWVLQLDADERVTPKLGQEISKVISMSDEEIEKHQKSLPKRKLFLRHQKIVEKRDGKVGTDDSEYAAFFLPRLNYFLGTYLKYGGVYPDGVIRLIRKGKANLPAKSVHEQMEVDGKVGWLENDLLHIDSPTFTRYLQRNSRYIDLIASELKDTKVGKDPLTILNYFLVKPIFWFLLTQLRHKGILDGFPGIVFSFFSSLRFPRAYWRYMFGDKPSLITQHQSLIQVFIDTSPLATGHAVRGVGFYTRELVKALKKDKRVKLVQSADDADLIHYPFFDLFFLTLPPKKGKPVVVTIHDVIPLLYPKQYKPGLRGKAKFLIQKRRLQQADAIITDSETSRKDIVRLLNIPQEKVFVAHLAPAEHFKKMGNGKWQVETKNQYGLPERFVLYVGDVNYNKNVQGLIHAFSLLTHKSPITNHLSLVLVGKGFEEQTPEVSGIFKLIKDLNLETSVKVLGFVPDEDLIKIYNLASVVCQPSFYEGFGFPVLEAQACGIPVVASKTQCLVEMSEGAAVFVKPNDYKEMSQAIKKTNSDNFLRRKLVTAGTRNIQRYSWKKTVEETIKVYEKVI